MSEDQKRPEATHRQRADLGHAQLFDLDGRPHAVISTAVSDLVPTVQFGNILVGPVVITRAVPLDPTPEELAALDGQNEMLIEVARKQQKATEFICGAERRVLQWAIDPSTRVINPINGAVVTPNGDVPAPHGYDDGVPVQDVNKSDPAVVAPPPSAQ